MKEKLLLISYISSKYNRQNKIIQDTINFIFNYEKMSYLVNGYTIDEPTELSNYILSYLNDNIIDVFTYKLCLDTAIYADNYHKINQKDNFKNKILINM